MKIITCLEDCEQGDARRFLQLKHTVVTECIGRLPQRNGGEVTIETCRCDDMTVVIIVGKNKDGVHTELVVIP